MTGTEILNYFHNLIDNDVLDSDFELELLNAAKDEIEAEEEWEMLKKEDSSQSADNSAKILPTDFISPLFLYVGNETQAYAQIPFHQKNAFVNTSRRFYLDIVNNQYYLLGNTNTGTIHFFYIYQTPDVTISTSPVWPAKFHKLVAYKMAQLFYMADQTERQYAWSTENQTQYLLWKNLMKQWDYNLKKRAIENGLQMDEVSDNSTFNLGTLG